MNFYAEIEQIASLIMGFVAQYEVDFLQQTPTYFTLSQVEIIHNTCNETLFEFSNPVNFFNFINLSKETKSINPKKKIKVCSLIYLLTEYVNKDLDTNQWSMGILDRLDIDTKFYAKKKITIPKMRLALSEEKIKSESMPKEKVYIEIPLENRISMIIDGNDGKE